MDAELAACRLSTEAVANCKEGTQEILFCKLRNYRSKTVMSFMYERRVTHLAKPGRIALQSWQNSPTGLPGCQEGLCASS